MSWNWVETWILWKLQRGIEEDMSAKTFRAICVQGDALKRAEMLTLGVSCSGNAGWHPEEKRCLCYRCLYHQLSLPESIAAGFERVVCISEVHGATHWQFAGNWIATYIVFILLCHQKFWTKMSKLLECMRILMTFYYSLVTVRDGSNNITLCVQEAIANFYWVLLPLYSFKSPHS